MAIFVLDTDKTTPSPRPSPPKRGRGRKPAIAAHATDTIAISTVTLDEQIGGWSALARSAKTAAQVEHFSMFLVALVDSWRAFAIMPFTIAAIAQFDSLVKAKLGVKRNDLRIAAIALELGATVVTRNRRDFGRVPGLSIEDWSV